MSFDSDFYDAKEQIRQSVAIDDLVRSYIELRPKGRIFLGHCPWHEDSHPSLQVNPERQSWRCWVCDIGGDVFSFVMQREQVEFREALEILADRAGIVLQRGRGQGKVEPGTSRHKPTLFRVMAWAEEQFHNFLLHSPDAGSARRYLRDRDISADSIERFHIGFSPDSWQWLIDRARGASFSPAVLEAVGLAGLSQKSNRHYDWFRGRLLFPIRDPLHRCVAFGARVLPAQATPQTPKYVNSPDTRLFTKSDQLYGLDIARDEAQKSRELVVVEGYTDVVMAHQVGVSNVVAVLGTALNERHIANMRRFSDRIALVLDGDAAGRSKAAAALEHFVAEAMDLRVLNLPDNLDPFDFFGQFGAEPFYALLKDAPDALDHNIQVVTEGIDLLSETHDSSSALENVLTTLARTAPTAAMRIRLEQILGRVARKFGVDTTRVRQRLQELRIEVRSRSSRSARKSANETPAEKPQLTPLERELFGILSERHEIAAESLSSITLDDMQSSAGRSLLGVYVTCHESDRSLEFGNVLASIEDPHLKNILVAADEEMRLKSDQALESAPERLDGLLRHFVLASEARARREAEMAMQNGNLDDKEELLALQQVFQSERNRQGISAPTDG